jgi:hypothetical protein
MLAHGVMRGNRSSEKSEERRVKNINLRRQVEEIDERIPSVKR